MDNCLGEIMHKNDCFKARWSAIDRAKVLQQILQRFDGNKNLVVAEHAILSVVKHHALTLLSYQACDEIETALDINHVNIYFEDLKNQITDVCKQGDLEQAIDFCQCKMDFATENTKDNFLHIM